MNLLGLTDCYMQEDNKVSGRTSQNLYPSEASVAVGEGDSKRILGHCNRATFFRIKEIPKSNPTSARSYYIFGMGRVFEGFLIDTWKEMGIWVEDGTKFTIPKIGVSGRLDVIVRDKESKKLIGIEIKTAHGYYAMKSIVGNGGILGAPKDQHLMQTAVYADHFRDNPDGKNVELFKIIYLFRDNAARAEFDVKIIKEDGKSLIAVNSKVIKSFTVDGIYARYVEVKDYIIKDTMPPRDFSRQYTSERIERDVAKGELGKQRYNKWKKNPQYRSNWIGDWQCSYCNWQSHCYGDKEKGQIE